MRSFGNKSKSILEKAHPDLKILFETVLQKTDITIICSYRNKSDQEKAFIDGFSKAHFGQSPHNFNPSLAVDSVPSKTLWSDKKELKNMGRIIKETAEELNIQISWGGDWDFVDMPHTELKNWRDMV